MGRGKKNKKKNKEYSDVLNRPVMPETTDLVDRSSLSFIPPQVLPSSSGITNPTTSSPTTTTNAGLNSSTIAKNEDKGKGKVDDAKTDDEHEYERGTDVKVWSPSMDGIAGDVPPALTSGFPNEEGASASEVSMENNELNNMGHGIAPTATATATATVSRPKPKMEKGGKKTKYSPLYTMPGTVTTQVLRRSSSGKTNPTTLSPTTTGEAGLNTSTIAESPTTTAEAGLNTSTIAESSTTRPPIKAETTDLADKSSLAFIPPQVLLSSSGKTNPTTSSPTTKAGLNSSTIAKNKDKEKKKVDDAKTDDGHDYERGTDVKVRSPSMAGIAGDVPPALTSGSTNEGASEVYMVKAEGIAEKVLYGSGRSSLSAFEELGLEFGEKLKFTRLKKFAMSVAT